MKNDHPHPDPLPQKREYRTPVVGKLSHLLGHTRLFRVIVAFCLCAGSAFGQFVSDLQVVNFTNFAPRAYSFGGHPTNYTYRIINFGPNSSGAINIEFILSRNLTLGDGDDIPIGTRQDSSSLPAGSISTISVSSPSGINGVTMPVVNGSFYVWMRVSHASGSGRTDPNPGDNVTLFLNPSNSSPVLISVGDATPPIVTSIQRWSPLSQTNNLPSVQWLVNFSESVQNVSVADFTLVDVNGTITNEAVIGVNPSGGQQIFVTASTGLPGNAGDLRLDVLAGVATIQDLAGNSLNTNFTNGQIYTVDRQRPVVLDLVDVSPDPRTIPVDTVDVIFSEPVFDFAFDDLSLTRNGMAVPLSNSVTIAFVSGSTFRISGLASSTVAAGNYVLTVNAGTVFDHAGNGGSGSASDSWAMGFPPNAIIFVDAAYGGTMPNGTFTDPFRTVSEAYNVAADSNTIRIAEGNYAEALTLNKALRVEATNGIVSIGR